MKNKNKILLIDLETSPTLGYVWQLWEANCLKVVKPWKILCFAYKWFGDSKTHVVSLPMVKNEKELVKRLWSVFNEADIIIAHNGDKFDVKKSYAKFIEHGLTPPMPFKTIDTLKVARRYFKFDSNRLDALGELLGVGRKLQTGGFDLWDKCMQGDRNAYRVMERYNKQDVYLLERIYIKLRPWMTSHPNLSIFNGNNTCPVCGSHKLQKRGYNMTVSGKTQRVQCMDCGRWSTIGNNKKLTDVK
jgi:hypothetical protein